MTKWFAGLAMLYLIMTVTSNILEGAYLGGGDVATLWSGMSAADPKSILVGIGKMLSFDYAFFVGTWAIFRWVFVCISVGIFVGLLLQMQLWMVVACGVVGVGILIGLYS